MRQLNRFSLGVLFCFCLAFGGNLSLVWADQATDPVPCRLTRWGVLTRFVIPTWSLEKIDVAAASEQECRNAALESLKVPADCLIPGSISPQDSMAFSEGREVPCPVVQVGWRFKEGDHKVRGVVHPRDLTSN